MIEAALDMVLFPLSPKHDAKVAKMAEKKNPSEDQGRPQRVPLKENKTRSDFAEHSGKQRETTYFSPDPIPPPPPPKKRTTKND